MKLSVIIVSYNTKTLLKKCLESVLLALRHPELNSGSKREEAQTLKQVQGDGDKRFEVTVVDNASTDGSPEMVKKEFPQVKLIQNKTNTGFAVANNQAIRQTSGKYIFLLNSDAEVSARGRSPFGRKKDTLNSLVDFMDSHPKAAIASAQLHNPDGTIQQSGGFIPRLSNIFAWMFFLDDLPLIKKVFWSYHQTDPNFYEKTRSLGWVQGAAMILRKSALEDIGLFDENIFMYGEDIDLCMRAKKAGWQVWSVAEAQAIHHRFQSGGEETAILGEVKGLKYLFQKHKPAWELPLLRLILKLGLLLRALLFATILPDTSRYGIYKKAFGLA